MDDVFGRIGTGLFGGNDTNPCQKDKLDAKTQDGVHNIDDVPVHGTVNVIDKGNPTAIDKLDVYDGGHVNYGFSGGLLQELARTGITTNTINTKSDGAVITFHQQGTTEKGDEANLSVNCANSNKDGAIYNFGSLIMLV